MIDREKRRNLIRKLVRFWFEHNLAIAITVAGLFIVITAIVLCVCLNPSLRRSKYEEDNLTSDYSSLFDTSDTNDNSVRKNRNITSSLSGTGEEQIEYSTLLQFNSSTKNGYMNNCIFLGDSRTVAMVSYGFVSDENVLAKVGISHPSVLNATFTQNSGKEYTVKKYLESHKAPVIYLAFGVNGMGGSDEKYEKSFKELVEAIMEMAPDSEIVIMSIGPVDDNGPYKKTCQNSWINKYNEFLYALAEYEGIYYLDVDNVLKGEDGQVKPEYDAGDGLHYKACAYTVMLEYIIHHPVPGVSDDGEFVVKYVKPTGQFKKMVKDEAALPSNVVIEENKAEGNQDTVVIPSPSLSPSPYVEKKQEEIIPTVFPSLSPSPIIKLSPSPTAVVNNKQDEALNVITPTPTAILRPEPVAEPTPEPTAEVTPEPASQPNDEQTAQPTEEPTMEPTEELTPEPTEETTTQQSQE